MKILWRIPCLRQASTWLQKIKNVQMKKALVISGGGSKGAFAVGVYKHLISGYALDFDVLVGTSTGSLIVPL
ncbi:MAG: patatin-like phospholipase family protein, partial [Chitinophagaceae bacterium]